MPSNVRPLADFAPAAAGAERRILCVFPHYVPSFGTFEYAHSLTPGVKAFMPPQGLLVIAAALPQHWQVRFIDENMKRASAADFAWADAVFVSGMHIQRRQMEDICARAHEQGKPVALGGPSVSAAPEQYPAFDYLHVGELGDATEALIELIARDVSRPPRQIILKTKDRRPLAEFPAPAYELAAIDRYFLGSIQFSSGCPYTCEFCDIPGLYGRVPRLKTPAQVVGELDKLLACGVNGSIYFVDDNLVGNRRALLDLLPHLVAWQNRNGYAVSLSCEATLNIARSPDILKLMREAAFDTIFCGIETPEPEALQAIQKSHNMVRPILESVKAINDHGMEVVTGIILGLDTDTAESGDRILEFLEQSNIPLATINLLQALPKTPLWDRLERDGRLLDDADRESNVDFALPYDEVLAMWRRCMEKAYTPEALFARYAHQMRATRPNRLPRPWSRQRLSPRNIRMAVIILAKLFWHVGLRGGYRRAFWTFALGRLIRGKIEPVISVGLVAHHLIMFARDACSGRSNASHYSAKNRPQGAATPLRQEIAAE
ncbi:Radical SAM domain protein [Methylocella silvestris BL2]|uniref:Radical SAM domain protein n=1 Tax=Methylocella silvestris (strain DSM 15510 / CIP 108128 / LMG 27833 / NCIMB 13906 / BL2) TaxID=395965 RepID=B8ENQ4_METSB|nr:B12-binding domain-containing radical SAM protein [Methylocella silvestris]ACK50840.1 Radical SAM domain protein [Methylocella silvestris BL2]